MQIRDIDKKLDMRLVLKLKQNTDLFNTTSELAIKLPTYIYRSDGSSWISTYFPKSIKSNNLMLLLKKFGAIEKENAFVIDSRINNVKDLTIINKLMELRSFVINRADMSGGFLNVYARFHSNELEKVSDLLADYTSDSENSRISWLGPNPGIIWTNNLINSEYPLSLVTFEITPEDEDPEILSLIKNQEIIAEMKSNESVPGKLNMILYSEKDDLELNGAYAISKSEGIYNQNVQSRILSIIRETANQQHIMRLRHFVRSTGEKLRISVLLPTVSVYEYYSLLYEIARKKEHKIVVRYLLPYSSDIWDFI